MKRRSGIINKVGKYISLAFLLASAYAPVQAYITHHVEKGETLWGISHKYKVSADAIISLNPSAANGIKAGSVLKIPANDTSGEQTDTIDTPETLEPMALPDKETRQIEDNSMRRITEIPIIRQNDNTTSESDTYTARYGDTFESISKKTGIRKSDLTAFNPLIDGNVIKEGEVIRLRADAPYKTNRLCLSTVDSVVYRVRIPETEATRALQDDDAIAIMLPFDLSHDEISRQSLLATDFYKGFLIAAKENSRNINSQFRIYAVDTQCSDDEFQDRLMTLAEDGVKIIVPSDDMRQTEAIEQFAEENGITVVNTLNIKDEGYINKANVVQCNISQKTMYDKAIQTLLTDYSEYTPVILDLEDGKDEKLSFIEELRSQYGSQGKEVLDLPFEFLLTEKDLSEALQPDRKYIFIPKSGAIEVFEKFAHTLSSYIDNDPEYGRLKLFGYPDWVTFRGEPEELLHNLGAIIYSRFYFDGTNSNTEDLNNEFANWYGTPQVDVFPAQGTLGYDTGNLLFKMIQDGWLENISGDGTVGNYEGLQSAFHIVKAPGISGMVNEALYIIEFLPDGATHIKVI